HVDKTLGVNHRPPAADQPERHSVGIVGLTTTLVMAASTVGGLHVPLPPVELPPLPKVEIAPLPQLPVTPPVVVTPTPTPTAAPTATASPATTAPVVAATPAPRAEPGGG